MILHKIILSRELRTTALAKEYLVFRLVYDLTTKSPTGEFERL
jgi:hypothetical protein